MGADARFLQASPSLTNNLANYAGHPSDRGIDLFGRHFRLLYRNRKLAKLHKLANADRFVELDSAAAVFRPHDRAQRIDGCASKDDVPPSLGEVRSFQLCAGERDDHEAYEAPSAVARRRRCKK
jgi:hypothetical protein